MDLEDSLFTCDTNKWLHMLKNLYIIILSIGEIYLLGLGISPNNPKCLQFNMGIIVGSV